MFLFIAALAASTMPLDAHQTPKARPGMRIEGSFIQYADWMLRRTPAQWQRDLDAARDAGMRTIIVQWLEHGSTSYLSLRPDRDPTRAILSYADRNGMEVFLGLSTDDAWWKRWSDRTYLETARKRCARVAERAWKLYGRHRAFAGWYIPGETWDAAYTSEHISNFRAFWRAVSAGCKRLSGPKPVAIAPFFSGVSTPEVVRRTYEALLDGSGIDVVMLQDGVGARGWDAEIEWRVPPYFAAMRDACVRNGVRLWADLECFRLAGRNPDRFAPATAERLCEQLTAETPYVQKVVTFDWFHYMNPERSAEAAALSKTYRARCIDQSFLPTIARAPQVDPGFGYYCERSPESTAAEIRANGYSLVHYVVTNDRAIDAKLADAFRDAGIGAWYLTFGNGTYSAAALPEGWQDWKMVTRSDLAGTPLNDGYTRLCLNNPAYRAWKKQTISEVLKSYPFVGVEIAEPHWPEYPGISAPAYACFCSQCKAAFLRMFPEETELPDVLDSASPRHPDRNPALWEKWLRFRRLTLTAFLDDIVNGPGGVRQTCPSAKVCTWTLALLGPDGPKRVLEDSGEDAGDVVRTVRPDAHCLQTHWPDWLREDIEGNYVEGYQAFLDGIRAVAPALPVVFQADAGSQKQNRRSWNWIARFERACRRMGAQGSMFYEYFIGGYIYDDPPRIVEATRRGNRVRLCFTKRLDPATAGSTASYTVSGARLVRAEVDGSLVSLTLADTRPSARVRITARGIADASDRRLFADKPPCVLAEQAVVAVDE